MTADDHARLLELCDLSASNDWVDAAERAALYPELAALARRAVTEASQTAPCARCNSQCNLCDHFCYGCGRVVCGSCVRPFEHDGSEGAFHPLTKLADVPKGAADADR